MSQARDEQGRLKSKCCNRKHEDWIQTPPTHPDIKLQNYCPKPVLKYFCALGARRSQKFCRDCIEIARVKIKEVTTQKKQVSAAAAEDTDRSSGSMVFNARGKANVTVQINMTLKQEWPWNMLSTLRCKYCCRHFGNTCHYITHKHNHELNIKSYWYKRSKLSPKAGLQFCVLNKDRDSLSYLQQKNGCNDTQPEVTCTRAGRKLYKCGYCSKSFSGIPQKKQHEMEHKVLTCNGNTLKNSNRSVYHVRDIKNKWGDRKDNALTCSKCNKTFKTAKGKKLHEIMLHKLSNGRKKCARCDKPTFTNHVHIDHSYHYQAYDSPSRACKCHKGRKDYGEEAANKQPAINHTSGEESSYLKPFSIVTSIESKASDEDYKPYKCRNCDERFPQRDEWQAHQLQHFNVNIAARESIESIESSASLYNWDKAIAPFRRACEMPKNSGAFNPNKSNMSLHRNSLLAANCKYCYQWFASVSRFLSHKRRHELHIRSYWYRSKHHVLKEDFDCQISSNFGSKLSEMLPKTAVLRAEKVPPLKNPHQCSLCGKSFPTLFRLKSHEKIHISKPRRRTYKCSFCGKICPNHHVKTEHERVHTKEKPYECKRCWKRFTRLSARTLHERIQHKDLSYKCRYNCGMLFGCMQSRLKHECSHDKDHICNLKPEVVKNNRELPARSTCTPFFVCRYCGGVFRSKGIRTSHERRHATDPSGALFHPECYYCHRYFSSPDSLHRHEKTTHGLRHEKYTCRVCEEHFVTSSEMMMHKLSHPLCTQCDKVFKTVEDLKSHLETHALVCSVCKPIKVFTTAQEKGKHELFAHKALKCLSCDQFFVTKESLETHQLRHSTEGISALMCKLCTPVKFFETTQEKLHHEQWTHIVGMCRFCNKHFLSSKLKKHETDEHPDKFRQARMAADDVKQEEVNFHKCKGCDMMFCAISDGNERRKREFEKCGYCYTSVGKIGHESAHKWINERTTKEHYPYCEICNKTFQTALERKEHELNHSTKKCPHCNKYIIAYTYKKHVNSHEIEFPGKKSVRQCHYCDKYFVTPELLKAHEMTHVSDAPANKSVNRYTAKM